MPSATAFVACIKAAEWRLATRLVVSYVPAKQDVRPYVRMFS